MKRFAVGIAIGLVVGTLVGIAVSAIGGGAWAPPAVPTVEDAPVPTDAGAPAIPSTPSAEARPRRRTTPVETPATGGREAPRPRSTTPPARVAAAAVTEPASDAPPEPVTATTILAQLETRLREPKVQVNRLRNVISRLRQEFPETRISRALALRMHAAGASRAAVDSMMLWSDDDLEAELRASIADPDRARTPWWPAETSAAAQLSDRGGASSELVRAMSTHRVPRVRMAAVRMAYSTHPAEIELIQRLAREDDSAEVREFAVIHVGELVWDGQVADGVVRELILGALDDPAQRVRDQAVDAIRGLGDRGSGLAMELLSDPVFVLSTQHMASLVEVALLGRSLDDVLDVCGDPAVLQGVIDGLLEIASDHPDRFLELTPQIHRVLLSTTDREAVEDIFGSAAELDAFAFLRTTAVSGDLHWMHRFEAARVLASHDPEMGFDVARQILGNVAGSAELRLRVAAIVPGGTAPAALRTRWRELLAGVAENDPNRWVRGAAQRAVARIRR